MPVMQPNVLHLIDSFDQGGTERQALQLARLLRDAGQYRVHLACLKKRGLLLSEAENLGVGEIVEFPLTSFYDANFFRQIKRLRAYLLRHEIKLVHTHDFYTNIFGMTAARVANARIARIASKRETAFRTNPQQRAERFAFRLAQRIVANADAVRNKLIDEGVPGAKIVTLYNGLDSKRVEVAPDWNRAAALRELNIAAEPGRKFVALVANLRHRVKDIPTFLRAARRTLEAAPQTGFIIAGEGELESELRALAAELNVTDDVFFIGRSTRIADLLALAEICVLSSQAEGFSNSILEYMAAGRAVVATDVGGAREAIEPGASGYLVAAGDAENMAEHLIELLRSEPKSRAFGARGHAIVTERFSVAAQVDSTHALYAELLNP